jgi:hypothetical protein
MRAVLEVGVSWNSGLNGREGAVGCCDDGLLVNVMPHYVAIAKARKRSLPETS